jgi:hypothetical protein
MKVLVIKNLPDHHGGFAVDVDLTGKEIEVEAVGMLSQCGGLLFEVIDQEKYWKPPHGKWLGVCAHEIKLPASRLFFRRE